MKVDVRRILIAARGALAPRLLHSYRALDLETVIAFGPTEADAPYLEDADFDVWLGEGEPEGVWSDARRVVSVALDAGCDGIHPGNGPLARSLDLCSIATAANVGLIGLDAPRGAELLDQGRVRGKLRAHGVALAPESALPRPDTVEIVVVADRHGTVVVLGGLVHGGVMGANVLEMGPATASPEASLAAERAIRALGYVGVGSVLLQGPDFVALQPHLPQGFELVELVHGIDLVEAQLRVALGRPLGWSAEEAVGLDRYGVMAWLSAQGEGTIESISVPTARDGRTTVLVAPGGSVAAGADKVLATVAARAMERASAREAVREVLQGSNVVGVPTDLDSLQAGLAEP